MESNDGQLEKVCIIHNSSISDPGPLQTLTDERLQQFHRVRKKRLLQPLDDVSRMADICIQIPDAVSAHHGYHTNCSKRFTMNLKRLRVQSENNDNEDNATRTGHSPRKKAAILFPRECIFCGSESYIYDGKGVNRKKQYLSRFEYYGGGSQKGETLASLAKNSGDFTLYRKVAGVDLFAVEAMYHRKCNIDYRTIHERRWRSKIEGK